MQVAWLRRLRSWFGKRLGGFIPRRGRTPLPWCDLTYSWPLPVALWLFRRVAPHRPRQTPYVRYAREVMGIPEAELPHWYAEAWWNTHAASACRDRLDLPHRQREVLSRVEPVDWGPVDRALAMGRGMLLCSAHWGVPRVAGMLLERRGMKLTRIGLWAQGDGSANAPADATRTAYSASLMETFRHLRHGGVAAIAADGPWFREGITERFFNQPCSVSLTAAALTRLTGAPAVRAMCHWKGHRLRVVYEEPILPQAGGDTDEADRRWMREYLDWIERTVRPQPRLVRFDQLHPRVAPLMEWLHAH